MKKRIYIYIYIYILAFSLALCSLTNVKASRVDVILEIKKVDAATGEPIQAKFNVTCLEHPEYEFNKKDQWLNTIQIHICPREAVENFSNYTATGWMLRSVLTLFTLVSDEVYNEPMTLKIEEVEVPEGYELSEPIYIYIDKDGNLVDVDNLTYKNIEGLRYKINTEFDTRSSVLYGFWPKSGMTSYGGIRRYELVNRKENTSSLSITKNINETLNTFDKFKFKVKFYDYPEDFELKRYIISNNDLDLSQPDASVPPPGPDEYRINFITENNSIYGRVKSINVKCNEDYIVPAYNIERIFEMQYSPQYVLIDSAERDSKPHSYNTWYDARILNAYVPDESRRTIPANTYSPGQIISAYPVSNMQDANNRQVNMVNGEFEIELYAGQTAFFDGIPVGTRYEIYEEVPDGYKLVSSQNNIGEIKKDLTQEVIFTNIIDGYGYLKIKKTTHEYMNKFLFSEIHLEQ